MKNIKDLLETIDSYLSLYKLFHFCTCTEIIYGCLPTEHEAQPAICGHDIGVVGPFLSNRNVFRVVIAFFNTRRVGRIRDSYSNPRRNAPNPSSVYIRLCKYRKKVFYCLYKLTFLRKNAKLIAMALISYRSQSLVHEVAAIPNPKSQLVQCPNHETMGNSPFSLVTATSKCLLCRLCYCFQWPMRKHLTGSSYITGTQSHACVISSCFAKKLLSKTRIFLHKVSA